MSEGNNARKSINKYSLPLPRAALISIDRTSSPFHTGKLRNAIDFIAPLGTAVLAAADGVVTYVKDNSNVGGPLPAFASESNFIVVMHQFGEYTRYDHLAHGSAKVQIGEYVPRGKRLADVGMTGYTALPHLHFQVLVFTGINPWLDFDTIAVEDFD